MARRFALHTCRCPTRERALRKLPLAEVRDYFERQPGRRRRPWRTRAAAASQPRLAPLHDRRDRRLAAHDASRLWPVWASAGSPRLEGLLQHEARVAVTSPRHRLRGTNSSGVALV